MPQRASSQVESSDFPPVEDSTEDVSGATLLGTGLRNEVGEYNCFLNVIIQVGLSKVNFPLYYRLLSFICSCMLFLIKQFFVSV